jgi:hypothetical protein
MYMTNFLLATSVNPITYSITPNTTSINEGSTVTFTIVTTGIINGTILYWTNNGTSSAADFTDSVNSGSFTVTDGLAAITTTITKTLTNDTTTEGSETAIINLRTGSTSGSIVATASTVTINDTSLTPAYAVDFNGSNQYLSASSTAISNFGTGDFTVEAWVYPREAASKSFITNSDNAGATTNTYFNLSYFVSGSQVFFGGQIRDTSSQAYITGNPRHNINQWYHVALSRNSGACTLYVNGYQEYVQAVAANTGSGTTASVTITKSVTARATIIGAFLYSGYTAYSNCRLSGVRIIKDVGLYYAGGQPTPPVPYTSGTSLIACQSSSFVDSSGNGNSISAVNSPSITSYP